MNNSNPTHPAKMGLIFFMVHFWIFFFLYKLTYDLPQWSKIIIVINIILDLPVVFLSFFGAIYLMLGENHSLWVENYVLIAGSLFYFALGWLVGKAKINSNNSPC